MIYINNQPVNMVPQAMHTVSAEGLNLQPEEAQVYPPENNYTNIRDALLRLGIKATYRAIQSDNFVEDVSGWKLSAEGVGYFAEGNIGGWNINATTIYSDGNNIILDSANKKITVGASNPITIDGVNKRIQSDNYVSGAFGSGFHLSPDLLEVGNIACRGLIRTAVFQKDVVNVMGGNFAVLDGDVLDADMTALDASTLTTKATTTFSAGDILRIKDGTDDEWLEVLGSGTSLVDSYSESNQNASGNLNNSIVKRGQSFTATAGFLDSCKFYLEKQGSPTGNAIATLYAHTGTFGTNGMPTGAVLATSENFDVSTLTTSYQNITFNFIGEEKVTLVNGTKYFIVLEHSGGDNNNYVKIGMDASSPSHSGNFAYYDGSWHGASSADNCFYVYIVGVVANPYTVIRDKATDYGVNTNPAWKKGATVVNYRQSGDGGVYMTASESNAPYLSVFTHAGSPWTDLTTRLRIGKLDGYLGYPVDGDKYGIGIGDSTHHLKYDPTNHLVIEGGDVKTSASGVRVVLSGANNRLEIYNTNSNIGYFGNDGADGGFIYINQPDTNQDYPPVYITSAQDSNVVNAYNTNTTISNRPAFRFESNNANSECMHVKNSANNIALFISADTNNHALSISQSGTGYLVGTNVGGCYCTKAGVWTDASSKTVKENFESIIVLDKLKDLEILKYNYISERKLGKEIKTKIEKKKDDKRKGGGEVFIKRQKTNKHFTPMAEDFNKIFKLGNDDGISPADLAGVALQAIKELTEKVERLEKK